MPFEQPKVVSDGVNTVEFELCVGSLASKTNQWAFVSKAGPGYTYIRGERLDQSRCKFKVSARMSAGFNVIDGVNLGKIAINEFEKTLNEQPGDESASRAWSELVVKALHEKKAVTDASFNAAEKMLERHK